MSVTENKKKTTFFSESPRIKLVAKLTLRESPSKYWSKSAQSNKFHFYISDLQFLLAIIRV